MTNLLLLSGKTSNNRKAWAHKKAGNVETDSCERRPAAKAKTLATDHYYQQSVNRMHGVSWLQRNKVPCIVPLVAVKRQPLQSGWLCRKAVKGCNRRIESDVIPSKESLKAACTK